MTATINEEATGTKGGGSVGRIARVIGPVVEGVSDPNRKVLVGLFGPIEMPFVVRRVSGEWRVEAQPYFDLMNQ